MFINSLFIHFQPLFNMMQFLIQALDHTDENALARRMAARLSHFEGAQKWKRADNFVFGTAILNEKEEMIGSVMVMQFETEAEFEAYLAQEPYVTQNVWGDIKTHKTRVANVVI